jgi:DNA-binding transcriptional MerR regulator
MTTKELCRQTGITPREAQWWCEAGILRPDFIRHARSFDESEALVAAIVRELRRKGVSLAKIRRLRLRNPQGDFLIVTKRSRLWCTKEELIPCVAQAPGPCLVVSLEDLRRLHA